MGATAAIGSAVLGGGIQAFGQMRAGQYQRGIAYANAKIGDAQATDALRRGTLAAGRVRTRTAQTIGDQRAAFGAQGIAMDSGSALDLQTDAAKFGELDALTVLDNARMESWGLQTQAHNLRFQGDVAAKTGRQQALGTLIGTGSNILAAKYGFGG